MTIALNGWVTQAKVSKIVRNHQSILERNLLSTLGLELVQKGRGMGFTGEVSSDENNELEQVQMD